MVADERHAACFCLLSMTREQVAERLWRCEEAFRRAQQGTCPVRYRAALAALQEVEALAALVSASG